MKKKEKTKREKVASPKVGAIQIIGIALILSGYLGDYFGPGYYFWLAFLGAIILIIKNKFTPKWLSKIVFFISIVTLCYFLITLYTSF